MDYDKKELYKACGDFVYFIQTLKYFNNYFNPDLETIDKLKKFIDSSLFCMNLIEASEPNKIEEALCLISCYELFFNEIQGSTVVYISDSPEIIKSTLNKTVEYFAKHFDINYTGTLKASNIFRNSMGYLSTENTKLILYRETSYTIESIKSLKAKKLLVFFDCKIVNIQKAQRLCSEFYSDNFSCNIISKGDNNKTIKVVNKVKNIVSYKNLKNEKKD